MKPNTIKIIGIAATVVGFAATLVGNWVSDKKTSEEIENKVAEALASKATEEL